MIENVQVYQSDMLGTLFVVGFFIFVIWLFGNKLGIWKWLGSKNFKGMFRR